MLKRGCCRKTRLCLTFIFWRERQRSLPRLFRSLTLPSRLKRPVLKFLIKKTENHRNHGGDSQPLFLATQIPYPPVSLTSIGRWLKLTLQDAGIDIRVFKAHSTRGASSSAPRQSGVSVKDILTAAEWSRETTFNRFYYRPRHSVYFGTAVIS